MTEQPKPETQPAQIPAAPRPAPAQAAPTVAQGPAPARLPKSALPTFPGPAAQALVAAPESPIRPAFPSRVAVSSRSLASAALPMTPPPQPTALIPPATAAPALPSSPRPALVGLLGCTAFSKATAFTPRTSTPHSAPSSCNSPTPHPTLEPTAKNSTPPSPSARLCRLARRIRGSSSPAPLTAKAT